MGVSVANCSFQAHRQNHTGAPARELRYHFENQSRDDTYTLSATSWSDARTAAAADDHDDFETAMDLNSWWSSLSAADKADAWQCARMLWLA